VGRRYHRTYHRRYYSSKRKRHFRTTHADYGFAKRKVVDGCLVYFVSRFARVNCFGMRFVVGVLRVCFYQGNGSDRYWKRILFVERRFGSSMIEVKFADFRKTEFSTTIVDSPVTVRDVSKWIPL